MIFAIHELFVRFTCIHTFTTDEVLRQQALVLSLDFAGLSLVLFLVVIVAIAFCVYYKRKVSGKESSSLARITTFQRKTFEGCAVWAQNVMVPTTVENRHRSQICLLRQNCGSLFNCLVHSLISPVSLSHVHVYGAAKTKANKNIYLY